MRKQLQLMINLVTILILGGHGTGSVFAQQSAHAQSHAQTHSLTKLWETDTILKIPESVLIDHKNQNLYVSMIDGGGWEADGKGEVAILSMAGKVKNANWVTGLNAPKGLGRLGQKLYIADISEVVVVDMATGALVKKLPIAGALNLNDIATDRKTASIYVSDSKTAKIWRFFETSDEPMLYLDNIKGANGLKCAGDDLIFARGTSLWKADAAKRLTKIAEVPEGIDGIEPVGNGDYIVTAWVGYVYYVSSDGQVETLLDTYNLKKNTADIGFDKKQRILYIPSFNGKTLAAYQLR